MFELHHPGDEIIRPNFILVPSDLVTLTSPVRALTDPIGWGEPMSPVGHTDPAQTLQLGS